MKQENCCTAIGQVKRHADCNTCHLKPKQKIDISKYTLGIDPYDNKQTAVEWLANELYEKFEMKGDGALFNDLLNQAKEIEQTNTDNKVIHFAEWLTKKHTIVLMTLYEQFEEEHYKDEIT